MKKLRIIVISSTVFAVGRGGSALSGYGGLEVIAYQIAEGLAKKGHEVGLVAPDGSECPGCQVIPIGPERMVSEGKAYGGFPAVAHEGQIIREAHPGYWQHLLGADAIIDHSWQKYSYMLKAEGRLKAPVLGVCHAPVNTMLNSPPPVEKPCVVCISKDQASHYEALFSPHKARVAYNGIDPDFYKPVAGVKRTGRFLFLARFSTIKGPLLAIEACKKAGAGLDLVGDTSITNEPDYFNACKAKCDGEQIRMVGPASRGECVRWFSQAHCLLHPNFPAPNTGHPGFREPLGLAPLEAQACGTPCIAGRYGAMTETISEGATGLLVSSLDEMVRAIQSDWIRNIAQSDRDGCREWASSFNIDKMVDRYQELCYEAIEEGGW